MNEFATLVVIVTFTFLLAGAVKGVIGMGLPTVAMGMLGMVMQPVQAAALLVIPSLVTNVWQMLAGPKLLPIVKRFASMMICVCLGTFLGIGLLTGGSASFASAALGAVLAAYGTVGLLAVSFVVTPASERWLSPAVGLFTGVLTGATGVFVIPAVPYLNSLGMNKEELIQTLGLSFTVSTLALGTSLLAGGAFQASVAGSSLLALLPALAGMFLGQHIRKNLQPEVFRRWFFIGLLALGSSMFMRAIWSRYA